MEKLVIDLTALVVTVSGLLVVIGALVPGARRLAGKAFVAYVAFPTLIGAILLYVASSISKALTGVSVPPWLVLVPVLLLAPVVTLVLALRLLNSIAGALFGDRVASALTLRSIDRLFGRRRGRPVPATDDTADDHPLTR